MSKTYNIKINKRLASPRSKRYKDLGAVVISSGGYVGAGLTGAVAPGTSTPNVIGHSHANKSDLDLLSTDEGYLYIDGEKAKAGYADLAHDLTEDSPIREQFLSKIHDDIAKGVITFEQWIEFGHYLAGSGGAFLGMTQVGSLGEMDYLKVRKKAQFETLEIAEVRYVGGKLIVAPGDGVEIIAVENLSNGYKCYYKGTETDADGRTQAVRNKFKAGDQIYCKVTNATQGAFVSHYWWRLCTSVGNGWFVVSKNDCDAGSDAPVVGDSCAQLGNRTDKTRQSAIVLSTVEVGHSPLMALYGDIDSYSLEGKDHVSMGAGADGVPFMTVYGKAYIGKRDRSTYVQYTPENGVEIKAKISAESTIGGTNINQYITNQFGSDGTLSPIEKRQLLLTLIEVRQEYADLIRKAKDDGINADGYDLAFWNLLEYLTGETKYKSYLQLENGSLLLLEDGGGIEIKSAGVLSDQNSTSAIDREYFSLLLQAYYAERDSLNIGMMSGGDYTKTVIDGGLVTTGSLQVAGASGVTHAGITGNENGGDTDIRIWAGATKANRANAPFRVNQAGELWAAKAHISGAVTANSLTLGFGASILLQSDGYCGIILPELPIGCVRTVDVWNIMASMEEPATPVFMPANSNVYIGVDVRDVVHDTFNSNICVCALGYYKLAGFRTNINSRTYWSVVLSVNNDPEKAYFNDVQAPTWLRHLDEEEFHLI